MAKTIKIATLSKQSLQQLKNDVEQYKKQFNNGFKSGVEKATKLMYKYVKEYASSVIKNHLEEIKMEYDKTTDIGRVYTNNMVIIFNEMGTGLVGSNNPHPKLKDWEYDVNKHGEIGWYYPTNDNDPNPYKHVFNGQLYAWTKGLPSRKFFYQAYEKISKEIKEIVNMEISLKTGGK